MFTYAYNIKVLDPYEEIKGSTFLFIYTTGNTINI